MEKVFYYAQIILAVLAGFCGLSLLIGGIFMGSWIPCVIGVVGIIFTIVVLKIDDDK